jgi:hypothetical protein
MPGVTPFWLANVLRLALIVLIPMIALGLPGSIKFPAPRLNANDL